MSRSNTRSAVALAGVVSLSGAAVSAEIAWLHMRWLAATYGVICGSDASPHCAACPTAVGLLTMGLASLVGAAGLKQASARSGAGAR